MAARKHFVSISMSLSALVLIDGCAPSTRAQAPGRAPLEELAQDLRSTVACEDSREQLFEAYYRAYATGSELGETTPSIGDPALENEVAEIHRLLGGRMRSLAAASATTASSEEQEGDAPEAETDPLLHLIRLEMRSKIDPIYEETNQKLDRHLESTRSLARERGFGCAPRELSDSFASRKLGARAGDAVYAARRTMATAYQSCQVLQLPPVDNRVEDVLGVDRAVKIDSVGWGRAYRDLALLKKTHYYHRVTRSSGACLNQDRQPLVYDYGGVPKIVSDSRLNVFANSGGGPALGIDCSAFVSTAAASAGLRYKAGTANRPVYTRFVSRDFIDPRQSGWDCFEQIKVSARSTIRPGDIAAYPGHVVMVDSVGADPFGMAWVRERSQCDQLSVRNFDFVLIQSSSSKEHLGINRYNASEYLAEGGKMAKLFLKHAREACLSKFDQRVRTPSTSDGGVIRHLGTARCLAPRVELAHEDCVAGCPAL